VDERLVLARIRAAVLDDRLRLTEHAHFELLEDKLLTVDAESALLSGALHRVEPPTHLGESEPRYTIVGHGADMNTRIGVVCRFDAGDQLVVITCYEITA